MTSIVNESIDIDSLSCGFIKPTYKEITFATWVAFFAWVFAVYDFILFGTLLPEIGRHFGWSEAEQASIATWVALGGVVITFAIGPVIDRLGRRNGIIITVGGAAICSLLTAVGGSWGKGALIGIRSVAGLGYAEQTVNATYLSELYESTDDPRLVKRKGFVYSLVQGGWPIGALLAAALTAVLMPVIGWQGSFIFAAVPSFIVALLAIKLKESPQFQIHRQIVRLRSIGKKNEAFELAKAYNIPCTREEKGRFAQVLQGESLRAVLVLGFAHLLSWFPIQIFSVLGTTVLTSVHGVSFENSLIILVLSNIVAYVGYLAHGWLGDKIGRRNTIALGWVFGSIAFTSMLYAMSSFTAIVALYSLGLFFLIGPYSAMLFFISESFPTPVRGTAGAIVGAMGPIGAVLAGFGSTYFLSNGNGWLEAALWFGSFPCFLSGLLIMLARNVTSNSAK